MLRLGANDRHGITAARFGYAVVVTQAAPAPRPHDPSADSPADVDAAGETNVGAPTDSDAKKSKRIYGLDALRGIAVFLMIEQHVGIWLWRGPNRAAHETVFDYPFLVGFNALGGGAAPLFVTLAGVGSALFVAANRPRMDQTLVRRGIVLMGFGLVLNLLTPSWFSWGSWFVLHMMGFAMALGPVWRRLPTRALLAACAAVLVAAVVTQELLHTPGALRNERMRDVTMAGGPFRLALAESQFPILPWLTFYLAGFISGRWLADSRPGRVAKLGLGFMVLGGLGAGLYKAGVLPGSLLARAFKLQLGFFPASTAIVGLLLGGALLLIALVFYIEKQRSISANNPLVTLGRISLTLLMLHVWLFREVSRDVFVSPERPTGLWRGLTPGPALAIIFGFVILATIVSRYWHRVGYRFGAEWALRRIAG